MGRITRNTPSWRLTIGSAEDPSAQVRARPDTLAVEEPLELRVDGESVSMTMRTPGDDFDLALGWLATEAGLTAAGDVATLRHCLDEDALGRPTYNVVDAVLAAGAPFRPPAGRAAAPSSACGVCGRSSIEGLRSRGTFDVAGDPVRVEPDVLAALPARLRQRQRGFERTGGTHAAALFTAAGELLVLREDIGRHNAVDKVIGWAVRGDRLPLRGTVLAVSGRAGFEIAQKTALAGIPVLASVSAASSLTVELAREVGLTLVAFVRPPHLTVYAGGARLGVEDSPR